VLSDAMGRPVGGKGEMGVLDAIRQLHRERLELEVALKNARAASPRRWPATRDQAILASMVNAIVEADRPGAMAEEFAADRQDGVVSGRLAGRQVSFHVRELRDMQFAEARAFVLKRIDGTQQPQEADHVDSVSVPITPELAARLDRITQAHDEHHQTDYRSLFEQAEQDIIGLRRLIARALDDIWDAINHQEFANHTERAVAVRRIIKEIEDALGEDHPADSPDSRQ